MLVNLRRDASKPMTLEDMQMEIALRDEISSVRDPLNEFDRTTSAKVLGALGFDNIKSEDTHEANVRPEHE